MMTEPDVRRLIDGLHGWRNITRDHALGCLLRQAAEALEGLLPSHYTLAAERAGFADTLEDSVIESGEVAQLIPVTAWAPVWAARRGEAVRTFATAREAEEWAEDVGDAI